MDFKQYVNSDLNDKYKELLGDKKGTPYKEHIQVSDFSIFKDKYRQYKKRLDDEKYSFNRAVDTVNQNKLAREQAERDRIRNAQLRKEENKRKRKRAISKTLLLTSVIYLFLIPALYLIAPQILFKYIHFGWLLLGAVVSLIVSRISLKKREKNDWDYSKDKAFYKRIRRLSFYIPIVVIVIASFTIGSRTFNLSTPADFNLLGNMPFAGTADYVVTQDIDFEGKDMKGWGKMGEFSGTFEGNNHTLSNISIDRNIKLGNLEGDYGLVGYIKGGTVKNLSIKDSNVNLTYDGMVIPDSIGIIAGKVYEYYGSSIENCQVYDTKINIKIDSSSDDSVGTFIGGIVGYNYRLVKNCEFGYSEMSEDSFVVEVVDNSVYTRIGGIAGGSICDDDTEIVDCVSANAKITLKTNSRSKVHSAMGGIVGVINASDVIRCVSTSKCETIMENSPYEKEIYNGTVVGEVFSKMGAITDCVTYGEATSSVGSTKYENVSVIESRRFSVSDLPSAFSKWKNTNRGYPTPCDSLN